MYRTSKPSKSLGFCQVRRVAHGHFIILHARARMENNECTLRNPAHWVGVPPLQGLKMKKQLSAPKLKTASSSCEASCSPIRFTLAPLRSVATDASRRSVGKGGPSKL
jgi:hypothetical protein